MTESLPELEPGFHFNVPENIYHRLPYLNATTINAFQRSRMEAWASGPWNYQEGDDEATKAQNFGSARHCLILEGKEELFKRFCRKPHLDDYPDAMRNMTEMKAWLKERGVKGYSGLNLEKLSDLVLETDPSAQIGKRLVEQAMRENAGKTFIEGSDWDELMEQDEKFFEGDYNIPRPGFPEVTVIWDLNDVRCKARIDWLTKDQFWDVKNFNNSRKKALERCITEKFCYEGIYVQMTWYGLGLNKAPKISHDGGDIPWLKDIVDPKAVILFLQTEVPNLIPRSFDPHDQFNLAQLAMYTIHEGVSSWSEWMSKGFEKPWQPRHTLQPIAIEHVPVSFLA